MACLELNEDYLVLFKTDAINRRADEAKISWIIGIVVHVGKELLKRHAMLDCCAAVLVQEFVMRLLQEAELPSCGDIQEDDYGEKDDKREQNDGDGHAIEILLNFKYLLPSWSGLLGNLPA